MQENNLERTYGEGSGCFALSIFFYFWCYPKTKNKHKTNLNRFSVYFYFGLTNVRYKLFSAFNLILFLFCHREDRNCTNYYRNKHHTDKLNLIYIYIHTLLFFSFSVFRLMSLFNLIITSCDH